MGTLRDKDAFPTPEMNSTDGKIRVWPGPGLTFFEHAAIQITQGIISSPGGILMEEDAISEMALKQAKSLVDAIERMYEEENEPKVELVSGTGGG